MGKGLISFQNMQQPLVIRTRDRMQPSERPPLFIRTERQPRREDSGVNGFGDKSPVGGTDSAWLIPPFGVRTFDPTILSRWSSGGILI